MSNLDKQCKGGKRHKKAIYLDSFSGAIVDLKKNQRDDFNILSTLKRSPRVSTWDMSELAWVRDSIASLIRRGLLVADKSEPYPWHRFNLTEKGLELIAGVSQ